MQRGDAMHRDRVARAWPAHRPATLRNSRQQLAAIDFHGAFEGADQRLVVAPCFRFAGAPKPLVKAPHVGIDLIVLTESDEIMIQSNQFVPFAQRPTQVMKELSKISSSLTPGGFRPEYRRETRSLLRPILVHDQVAEQRLQPARVQARGAPIRETYSKAIE